jgi:hypothetical protein
MKLITKEIEKNAPRLRASKGGDDAKVIAKFFNPVGNGTWFMTEYDPEDRMGFGFAEICPGCGELGYFSIDELESVTLPLGLGIERDLYFGEKTLKEAKATIGY